VPEEKGDHSPLLSRKPSLSQQLFLRNGGIEDLSPFIFQVVAVAPAIQIVDENIGIDQE